ncbi:hypothetical protein BKA81DRAFT_352409 [Phyllosticta paracitricarpa]
MLEPLQHADSLRRKILLHFPSWLWLSVVGSVDDCGNRMPGTSSPRKQRVGTEVFEFRIEFKTRQNVATDTAAKTTKVAPAETRIVPLKKLRLEEY